MVKSTTSSTAAMAVIVASLLTASSAQAVGRPKLATVGHWADGDSLVTSRGEVRLVGIDTPEVGSCGSPEAKALAEQLAPAGSRIALIRPAGVINRDRYGRLLRYVKASGVDVGLEQLRHGAVARYDSLDGYQHHPKQEKYRRVDGQVVDYCGAAPPLPLASTGRSYPPASVTDCPPNAPIKGNRDSMIYHVPGGGSYDVTHPEECFATEEDARNAGYRKAQN